MSDNDRTTRKLLGTFVKKTADSEELKLALDNLKINSVNAAYFESLIEGLSREGNLVRDLSILLMVVNVGQNFLHAKLIDDGFWMTIMSLKYSAETQVDVMLVEYLLREGLALNNNDAWKFLALLMELCHSIPRSKHFITNMVRENFGVTVGVLLDNIKNFQQANYVVELLSNCFPRNSINKPGVVLAPTLWESDEKKMRVIFENPLYPFRGRHGDLQVSKFIWNVFPANFEQSVLQLKNIKYSSTVDMKDIKEFGAYPNGMAYCCAQASGNQLYLWDGDGRFLIIERKSFEITKTSEYAIEIQIIGPPTKCIRSTDKAWLRSFTKVKWFQLNSTDSVSCETFFRNIKNTRKISEVQTFLALNHEEEPENEQKQTTEADVALNSNIAEPLSSEALLNCQIHKKSETKNQLATPELSDVNVNKDEWDFNNSSQQQEGQIVAATTHKAIDKMTPKKIVQDTREELYNYDEQSPLVLAQKRKMIRETTKTMDHIKKHFALSNEETDMAKKGKCPPSGAITKCETANKNSELQTSGQLTEKLDEKASSKSVKTPKVKSIGAKDIDLLDTIFGMQSTKTKRPRPKKQQRLRNFQPVVNVTSQDLPVRKTRSQRKSESGSVTKLRPKNLETHGDVGPKQTSTGTNKVTTNPCTPKSDKRAADDVDMDDEHKEDKKLKMNKDNTAHLAADVEGKNPSTSLSPQKGLDNSFDKSVNEHNKNETYSDSTTVLNTSSQHPQIFIGGDSALTYKLQEQISNSITHFSNELIRKMAIINKELNKKIVEELSKKYQRIFKELQTSFQSDTEEMLTFMGEIKNMMNVPEDELVQIIRSRTFNSR